VNIKVKSWLLFVFLALLSSLFWLQFTCPHFSGIDLSINRAKALSIAKEYLTDQQKIDTRNFRTAIVFANDSEADRYLQKTIGLEKEKDFFRKHDFEIFFWVIRFFQENKKEEFLLFISSATGEITAFRHVIDDSAFRETIDRETAEKRIKGFLIRQFNFPLEDYSLHADSAKKYDNRIDYSFSYEKKGVAIPWSEKEDSGNAKLLAEATISGDDILSFSKNNLDIPDQFNRFLARQKNVGMTLIAIIQILYLGLFVASIFYVVIQKGHVIMQASKPFYTGLAMMLFVLLIFSDLNQFEHILRQYHTTQPLNSYLLRYFLGRIMNILFATVVILLPGLSGETLNYELSPEKKERGFLYFIRTTFLSKKISSSIALGYLVCLIMIGIQSLAFEIGRRYAGVWLEHAWLTQLSSTYLPFMAAFALALEASLSEEIIFRLFAINWLRKILRSTLAAVFISSLLWGFGHSHYLVFPMWFRGVEVTVLGLFLSFIYLRHGIVPVIIGHYLFDVFWSSLGYLLGKTSPLNLYGAILALLLPLLYALLSFVLSRSNKEKELTWKMNQHQLYNLEILKSYLQQIDEKERRRADLRKEIIAHGWDIAVVETAIEEIKKRERNQ